MSRWIRIARRIHLVIALAVGFHFVLSAATGAIYIFGDELRSWSRSRNAWTSSPGDVGPDRAAAAIAEAFPEWDRAWFAFPGEETPFYTTYVLDGSDYFWTDVFVDPGTGQIIGSINNFSWSVEGVLQVAVQLHIRLCAGEAGRRIVDCSVVLLLIEIVTGLLLWWPGFARLRRAFVIRRPARRFLFLYDLHRVSGALAAPFLLLMVLTGLLWAFPQAVVPLVYWCCAENPPESFRSDEAAGPGEERLPTAATPQPMARLVATVQSEHPRAVVRSIRLGNSRARHATLSATIPGRPGSELSFRCDRLTGGIAALDDGRKAKPSFADRLTDEWAHELHYGTFGGTPTKVLYLAACGAVVGLYFTGIAMWMTKRRKRALRLRWGSQAHHGDTESRRRAGFHLHH